MKKKDIIILGGILAVVVVIGVVLAVFLGKPVEVTTTAAPVTSAATSSAKNDAVTEDSAKNDLATSGAKVINGEAIDTIKALSEEQLDLKNKDDYKFMVSNNPKEIDGEKYIEVIAAKTTKNHDGTFQIATYGKYFISFDGSKLMRQDMKTNKYITIK